MDVIRYKFAGYIVLVILAITCCIKAMVTGESVDTIKFISSSIQLSMTVITILTVCFCEYLWKCKCFRGWLVLIPDLNGSWSGTIHSDWIDKETNIRVNSISAELTIKQTLFKVSCIMKTNEMKSHSVNAGWTVDSANQMCQLVYIYISEPKQNIQSRSPMHYGTVMLDFCKSDDGDALSGNYWTGRKTSGFISMKKCS